MASCWDWRSEETGWLVSNDLVITRQEERGQQKRQEPPNFEFLSVAANSAISKFPPMLKVSFYSLHYMSVMKIPKFRVKIFVHIQEQNDCINTYMRLPEKPKTRKPQEGWLAKASFPHVS